MVLIPSACRATIVTRPLKFDKSDRFACIIHHWIAKNRLFPKMCCNINLIKLKGYATRERFLQRIRQNPPNPRKILSRDGVFSEIVIDRHAQLNRF